MWIGSGARPFSATLILMTGIALGLTLLLAAPAPLADFAFIAGHWQGAMGNSSIEEVWTKPQGDAMMGMFRLSSGGQTRLTEFMTIEQRESGAVLVMRHFSAGLIAREEKDAPLVWTVELVEPDHAVFFLAKEGSRLDFRRNGGTLTITLEKSQGGKISRTPFTYKLASPVPSPLGERP